MAWKRIIGFPDNTTQFLEVLMLRPVRIAALTALAAVAFASPLAALAQAYPSKPVTIVVPWPPGGPSDIAARPMAKGLGDELKQTFIIDNRGGAGGNIGSSMVAKAAPDGYTLLITSSAPIVINPSLYKSMPFDPPKDLAPITNLLRVPLILAVNPSVPAKNLQELIAYVNSQKGKAQYASSGNGTPQHLTAELFKSVAKLDMIHVPYKGSAPAITDLVGGHVPIMFDSAIAILPQIKAGKVRAIAITSASARRSCRTCRPSTRPASRASSLTRGTASSRRPRRRRTSSPSSTPRRSRS